MGGIMPSFFFPNKLVLLTASAEELLRPREGPPKGSRPCYGVAEL